MAGKAVFRIEGQDATGAAWASVQRRAQAVSSQISKFYRFTFAGVGVAAIVNFGREAIKLGDDLNKAAMKAGIAGQAMSELAYAAKQSDVDITGLSTALRKMQVTLSQASSGGKEQVKALRAIGLEIEHLQGLNADQQFELIADRIARLADEEDKARAATEIFGKAGADLLPMFEKGAAGIRMAREEAQRFGASLTDEQIKKLAEADDAIKRLQSSWEAFGASLVSNVAPALTKVLDYASASSLEDRLLSAKSFASSPLFALITEGEKLFGSGQEGSKRSGGRRGGDSSSSSVASPLGFAALQAEEEATEASRKESAERLKVWERFEADRYEMVSEFNHQVDADARRARDADMDNAKERLDQSDEWYRRWMENEKAVAEYRDEQMRQLSESEQIFKDAFLSAWDDMVNTGKIKWDELLKYLVAEFARRGIANLFDSIFTNSGGGGGGGFWSAAGNWISGLFGGARAGGGPVSAGKFYMVGEHGPEIMAAGMSGTVIPNHAIGGAITLAPTYNITNTSGDHRGLQRVMEENNRRMFETLERHYNLRPAT